MLLGAHKVRVARGDHHIDQEHLADVIEALVLESRETLSTDRSLEEPRQRRRNIEWQTSRCTSSSRASTT